MNNALKNKRCRILLAVLAAVIWLCLLAAVAYAEPDEPTVSEETQQTEATTEKVFSETEVPVTETEPLTENPTEFQIEPESEPESPAVSEATEERSMFRFTPDGQLTLLDDFEYVGIDADGNLLSKQFITVQSRDGSYFYIIIDRTGKSENVYFLNQVDLADLKALANNEKQTISNGVCTCTTHCTVGHIDTSCPVCSVRMIECAAMDKSSEADTSSEPQPAQSITADTVNESDKKQSMNPVLALVLTVVILGSILAYVFKGRKQAAGRGKWRKQPTFDFDEDEEDEELETEAAPTQRREPAPAQRGEIAASKPAVEEENEYILEEADFEDDQDLL